MYIEIHLKNKKEMNIRGIREEERIEYSIIFISPQPFVTKERCLYKYARVIKRRN